MPNTINVKREWLERLVALKEKYVNETASDSSREQIASFMMGYIEALEFLLK